MTAISVPNPLAPHREAVRQLTSFGAIGLASTLAYVAIYSVLREAAPAGVANALALVITAVGNTALNRRLTFKVQGHDSLARHHAAGLLALAVALAITSASLAILSAIAPHHGRLAEVAVLVTANATATLVRFLLLRSALAPRWPPTAESRRASDRDRDDRMSAAPALATLSQSERTRG
jgi:putative flippase GtrA